MKKVMFVIGSLAGGGAERVITSVASALAEKGFEVVLLTFYGLPNEYPYSSKIKRLYVSNGKYEDFQKMSILSKVKNFRKKIIEEKPDEIISFLTKSSIYCFVASMFTKYRKRLSFAIRANPNMEKGISKTLHRLFSRYIKTLLVQNKGQAMCFSKKTQKKAVIIPNPMYDELFENTKIYNEHPKKIVSVGRLTLQKNFDLSIDAFYELSKKHPDLEYYIYGKGKEEHRLNQKIKSLGLSDKVKLLGFEKNREVIYGDKDIFLMTSLFEGMPNSLAEAMCYGVPSISINCDFGPSDLIFDDKMGVLLPNYDKEELVKALENVIDNYPIYAEKAKYARIILKQKYSYEKIISMWIDFINK